MFKLTIKRCFALFLTACMFMSLCLTAAASVVEKDPFVFSSSINKVSDFGMVINHYLAGDVNCDGVVNDGDATLVLRHNAKLSALSDLQSKIADINADGAVDIIDAVIILRCASPEHPEETFDMTINGMGDSAVNPMLVNGPYTISGTVSDVNSIKTLAVNGSVIKINPDGTWSKTINLGAGSHVLSIYIKDVNGRTATIARYVHCVPGPKVNVNHYLAGDIDLNGVVNGTDADVALSYEAGTLTETLSDIQLRVGDANSDGAITYVDAVYMLRAEQGMWAPSSVEINDAGNTKDNPMQVCKGWYTISGTISDVDDIKFICVNNEIATINPDGTWNANISLKNGLNAIPVLAINEDENATVIMRFVYCTPDSTALKGDVNFDGVVDDADVQMILDYDAKLITLTESQLQAGDFNCDGSVDIIDSVCVLKYAEKNGSHPSNN